MRFEFEMDQGLKAKNQKFKKTPKMPDPKTNLPVPDGCDASPRLAFGVTHYHACACREKAILEILVLVEPIMEAWAQSHELDEWHCRVEDLIGTAYPSLMYLPNIKDQPTNPAV
jgi:hypothetical protein